MTGIIGSRNNSCSDVLLAVGTLKVIEKTVLKTDTMNIVKDTLLEARALRS
jgi:hypothetical protein